MRVKPKPCRRPAGRSGRVPTGRYGRSRPLVFSTVARWPGRKGSRKQLGIFSRWRSQPWRAYSLRPS